MQFINREAELAALEKFWEEGRAQLIIIYGKRRVGKTEIIKQFMRRKAALYFLAKKVSDRANLRGLADRCAGFFKDSFLGKRGFETWDDFFSYVKEKINKPILIVLDEFPFLAEGNKAISSIFQAGWDECLKELPVFLILCGSSIAMMERETLAHKAPLYGRRTGQLFIRPMLFRDVCRFFKKSSFKNALEYYSVAGGTPAYLIKLQGYPSAEKAAAAEVLSPEKFLYEEVDFLLKEELRQPRYYFSILKAVALGKHKVSEIINDTGIEKSALHNYLFVLEDLHLIQKEIPITEKKPLKSRKGIYRLNDPFLIFWFNYVYPFQSELELGDKTVALQKIKETFNLCLAENYEKICQEIIKEYQTKIFPFQRVGRWWDRQEEIDLIALNEDLDQILFGEVKWSSKLVGVNIYEDLKRKAAKVKWGSARRREFFALFSRSGFTPQMLKLAKGEKILLFKGNALITP